MKNKQNLHLVLEYLTRIDPRATGGFLVQDDGEGPFLADWFEPNLGPRPTQEEIDAAEDDAIAWGAQKSISAGEFYGQLTIGQQSKLSQLAETDGIVRAFKDFLSMSGAKVRVGSEKTQAAVMYLVGVELDGNTISEPVLTEKQATDWLNQVLVPSDAS